MPIKYLDCCLAKNVHRKLLARKNAVPLFAIPCTEQTWSNKYMTNFTDFLEKTIWNLSMVPDSPL